MDGPRGLRVVIAALLGLSFHATSHGAVLKTSSPAISWHDCGQRNDGTHGIGTPRTPVSAAIRRCALFRPGARIGDRAVRLAVVRLQVFPDGPRPHPVVFVPGGPARPAGLSGRAIRDWAVFQQQAGWPRDLVLYDPRATGASRPSVICPPGARPTGAALARCHRLLGQARVDALGVEAQVADLHRLIRALGQGAVVLWAQSFGAHIVRRLVDRHPGDVDSVILESPALIAEPLGRRQSQAIERRMTDIVSNCRSDLRCRLAVPSARVLLSAWTTSLSDQPLIMTHARIPWPARKVMLDARSLHLALLFTGYDKTRDRAVVARLRTALGRPERLWPLLAPVARLAGGGAARAPAYWSSRCSVLLGASPVPGRVRRASATWSTPVLEDPRSPCAIWTVRHAPEPARLATLSGLLVYGLDDPLTPAWRMQAYLRAHPDLSGVAVAGYGHLALRHSRCAQSRVRRWLRHASKTGVVGSCVLPVRSGDDAGARPR